MRSRDRQLPGLPFFDDLPEVRCHLSLRKFCSVGTSLPGASSMPLPEKHNAPQAEYDRSAALVGHRGPAPPGSKDGAKVLTRGVQAWRPRRPPQ
jgi:hypothetical protein